MKQKRHCYFINLIFTASLFGALTGAVTAVVIVLYKACAEQVIALSTEGYRYLREHLIWLPLVVLALFGIAVLFGFLYRRLPNLRGGGIPTSIGILRGMIPFHWLKNLVGVFGLSLTSFLIGVPLGNEGPSVQMGTAIGRGTVFSLTKKHRAWDRYAMTGGACAGFSVATGAPISGILFAIEEAHQRISPMILLVSATSVLFSRITAECLAPLCGVELNLFPHLSLVSLSLKDLWIPVLTGLAVGLFSVLFLKYYRLISTLFQKKLKHIALSYKIFFVFLLTLIFGLCSSSFISTGHHLMLSLFDTARPLLALVCLLAVRATLTLCANSNSITGGVFVPILALGTVFSSLLGKTVEQLCGLSPEHYDILLVLGITSCIAGMMKMPLTAILFSIEALSCYDNILYVIIAATLSFGITELFGVKSINDSVLENRVKELNGKKAVKVIDTFVTVQPGSFATGKQIRDIFWPTNLFVLSLQRNPTRGAEVDEHGEKIIHEGDVLHVRYSTFNEQQTREELVAIVGDQSYEEQEAAVI